MISLHWCGSIEVCSSNILLLCQCVTGKRRLSGEETGNYELCGIRADTLLPFGSSHLKRMWKIYSNSKEDKICLCGSWRKLRRSSHTVAWLWLFGFVETEKWCRGAAECLICVLVSLHMSDVESCSFIPMRESVWGLRSGTGCCLLMGRCLLIPFLGR